MSYNNFGYNGRYRKTHASSSPSSFLHQPQPIRSFVDSPSFMPLPHPRSSDGTAVGLSSGGWRSSGSSGPQESALETEFQELVRNFDAETVPTHVGTSTKWEEYLKNNPQTFQNSKIPLDVQSLKVPRPSSRLSNPSNPTPLGYFANTGVPPPQRSSSSIGSGRSSSVGSRSTSPGGSMVSAGPRQTLPQVTGRTCKSSVPSFSTTTLSNTGPKASPSSIRNPPLPSTRPMESYPVSAIPSSRPSSVGSRSSSPLGAGSRPASRTASENYRSVPTTSLPSTSSPHHRTLPLSASTWYSSTSAAGSAASQTTVAALSRRSSSSLSPRISDITSSQSSPYRESSPTGSLHNSSPYRTQQPSRPCVALPNSSQKPRANSRHSLRGVNDGTISALNEALQSASTSDPPSTSSRRLKLVSRVPALSAASGYTSATKPASPVGARQSPGAGGTLLHSSPARPLTVTAPSAVPDAPLRQTLGSGCRPSQRIDPPALPTSATPSNISLFGPPNVISSQKTWTPTTTSIPTPLQYQTVLQSPRNLSFLRMDSDNDSEWTFQGQRSPVRPYEDQNLFSIVRRLKNKRRARSRSSSHLSNSSVHSDSDLD